MTQILFLDFKIFQILSLQFLFQNNFNFKCCIPILQLYIKTQIDTTTHVLNQIKLTYHWYFLKKNYIITLYKLNKSTIIDT